MMAICGEKLANMPPTIAPRIIAATVNPSTHPFAATNSFGGNNSVNIPYLAGEYDAAPMPTMPYEYNGGTPANIARLPTSLMAFEKNMTLLLGNASAIAPTKGAKNI